MHLLTMRAVSRATFALLIATTSFAATTLTAPGVAAAACAGATKSASGTVKGEDGRFISAQVSIELFASDGTKIGMDGCEMGGGYATTVLVNNKPGATCCFILPEEGSTTTPYSSGGQSYDLTKSWSISNLPSNAATMWIETYTKRSGGQPNTGTGRYGHTLRSPVSLNATNVHILQPLNCGLSGNGVTGTTGSLIGKVYDNGVLVTPTRVSAFNTNQDGGNAGPIRGFNVLNNHPSGSYRLDSLSPGNYSIFVTASGITKRFDQMTVTACEDGERDVAIRGSVPATLGVPVSGDWDGDGDDEPGIWSNGTWILRSDAGPSGSSLPHFDYGAQAGDVPVVGDWDGDGDDDAGIFRGGVWHLRSTAAPGGDTIARISYGAQPGDIPVPGDWDGDDDDEPGIFRRGIWHFRSTAVPAGSTIANLPYGAQPGDIPVPGDWDGDGDDEPGIYRRGTWHFRSAIMGGGTTGTVRYGVQSADVPLSGQWDGDMPDEPAIYRGGEFHLRGSNDGSQSTIQTYRFP